MIAFRRYRSVKVLLGAEVFEGVDILSEHGPSVVQRPARRQGQCSQGVVAAEDAADVAGVGIDLEDAARRQLPEAIRPHEHARLRAAVGQARRPEELPCAEIDGAQLTAREREVLTLVAAGKANKEVAAELGLSPKTVEVHRAHVMSKMSVDSLAELIRVAILAGAIRENP